MDELQTRSNLMRQKPCLSIITVRQLALASTVPKPGHPNAVVQVAPVPSLARRNTGHLNPTIVRVLNHFHCRKAAKAVYLTTILLPVEVVVSGYYFLSLSALLFFFVLVFTNAISIIMISVLIR